MPQSGSDVHVFATPTTPTVPITAAELVLFPLAVGAAVLVPIGAVCSYEDYAL
jgi:hypothetical protein